MAASNWRESVIAQLKDRDALEKTPFEPVISSHVALWNANQALIKQRDKLKASALSGTGADGSVLTGGPSAEKTKELERKIEQLQSELTASYRKEAREATSQLALEAELRQLQANEQNLKAAIERLRLKLKETQALLEEEQRIGGRAREEATTLRDELLRTRRLLESAESKNRQLTKENANLLERVLSDKLRMAEELNQMSQMYEELQQRLRQRDMDDRNKKKESELEKGAESAGGEEEQGMANGSTKTDGGVVKGGVKRTQAGAVHVDSEGIVCKQPEDKAEDTEDQREPIPVVGLKFQAHPSEIPMIRYDETGSRLVTCSCDGTIKLWDSVDGKLQKTLRSPVDIQLMGMDVKEKVVIATGSDRTVRVWNLDTERVVHTLTGHASKLYACRLTPDAKTVVSGGTDRKVMIWDVVTGNRTRLINCSSIVNAVAVSPDGMYIATGHQDTSVRIWDIRSGKMMLAVTDCHSSIVTSVEFVQSGRILTNSRDNTIAMVDLVSGKALSRFGDMNYKAAYNWSSADASPYSGFVGAGGSTGQVFIWSTKGVTTDKSATKASAILDHSDNRRIAAFCFNPSGGGRCASADENGLVTLWSPSQ